MNSNAQPKPYIVAERVCKSFGTHQVLKDVSTVFHTGEVTVIIGASGSGKSTLLRAINRLEPHDSGRITIDGVDVCDDLATLQRQRCEVGMVFQQFNLFGHMSVLDNVTLAPRRIRKTPRPQATTKPCSCCAAWACRTTHTSTRGNCRAGSSSGWPLPARWPCNPR